MDKIIKIISIAVFFITVLFFTVLTVILPKFDFSEAENRTLSQFPELSFKSVYDESFMNGAETYVSDHFAFRTSLFSVKTNVDRLFGKNIVNGVIFLEDRFVMPVTDIDENNIERNVLSLNEFAKNTSVPVYVMIAPTSAGVYASEIPSYYANADQRTIIENISYELDNGIIALNPFSILSASRDEYIYYRNDHHWTTYGAFIAYNATIKLMGYNPVPFSNCDIEHVNSSFYGTLYSKTLYDGFRADVIDNIHVKGGYSEESVEIYTGTDTMKSESMFFSHFLDLSDKYSYFLNRALYPEVTIKTNYPEENNLLVIKDSYAHCFVPFLVQHFSKITMLDLRSISVSQIEDIINTEEYDQILVLYNFENFATDINIRKLSLVK